MTIKKTIKNKSNKHYKFQKGGGGNIDPLFPRVPRVPPIIPDADNTKKNTMNNLSKQFNNLSINGSSFTERMLRKLPSAPTTEPVVQPDLLSENNTVLRQLDNLSVPHITLKYKFPTFDIIINNKDLIKEKYKNGETIVSSIEYMIDHNRLLSKKEISSTDLLVKLYELKDNLSKILFETVCMMQDPATFCHLTDTDKNINTQLEDKTKIEKMLHQISWIDMFYNSYIYCNTEIELFHQYVSKKMMSK